MKEAGNEQPEERAGEHSETPRRSVQPQARSPKTARVEGGLRSRPQSRIKAEGSFAGSAQDSTNGLSGARGGPRGFSLTTPDEVREAEADELAHKLSLVAAVRVAVVTLCLVVLVLLVQFDFRALAQVSSWQFALIGVTYALSLVYAASLRHRRLLVALAYAQIALDSLIVSVVVLMTGGIESVFTFAYVFTVLGASLTLYRTGAITATITSFLTSGIIVLLQTEGILTLLPTVNFGNAMFSFFMYSVGMGLVAWLASALAEKARITGRRLAQKQSDLERLEDLHAAILRSLPAGLMTVDVDGKVRYANDAALGILQWPSGELVGAPLMKVIPSMADKWMERRRQLVKTHPHERYEESFQRPNGTTIRIGFSFAPLSLTSERWMGSIVVFQDVTDIVRLKQAVERAERLATIGKLSAGFAHEVRNPLASMCASIDVLKNALSPPEPMQRLMTNVVKEADRLNGLISDFLRFARPREPQIKKLNLTDLILSVVDVFRNDQMMSGVQIETSLEPNLEVQVDEDLIRQVIWNLVRNAGEAMSGKAMKGKGGVLFIAAYLQEGRPSLLIRDNGPGIPRETIKRIFDPFYTTKEGGSGLGLAMTHSIVEAHGGEISLESQVGEGTEFRIGFPEHVATSFGSDGTEPTYPDEYDEVGSKSSEFELISGMIYTRP